MTSRQEGTYNTNYKFTGKEYDSSSALCYYGARYYDAEIGRFITADSIVQAPYDPQSLNRYTYCRNNPVNLVDPTGHFAWIPFLIGIIKGAIAGSLIGGTIAAATGGDIGQGFLTGAISGAVFGFVGGLYLEGAAHTIGHVIGGAASGSINASIIGSDVGMGALIGGISAGASECLGSIIPKVLSGVKFDNYVENLLLRSAIGAIVGGGISAGFGGSFGEGAQYGATSSAIAYTANEMLHDILERAYQRAEKCKDALNVDSGSDNAPTRDIGGSSTKPKEVKDLPLIIRIMHGLGEAMDSQSDIERKAERLKGHYLKKSFEYFLNEEWPRRYYQQREEIIRQKFERADNRTYKIYGYTN